MIRIAPKHLLLAASLAVAATLLLVPAPGGAPPVMMRGAAVVIAALGMWATNAVPSYFGALAFMFLAMILAVAPAPVVFSGFHSGATWLVFGGLVIGMGVHKTGLDVRLVRAMLRLFPRAYLPLLYGVFIGATAMTVMVPSASGRVALLVPIVMALATRLGYGGDSNGRTGLVLAATMGTMIPGFTILPSNVPNMGLYGAAESIYGIHLQFGDYLLLNFPVLAIGGMIVYPLLIWRLFRAAPPQGGEIEAPARWTWAERRLLAVVGFALLLWVTDRWHGISPAWVALGAALLIVTPRVGALPITALVRDLDYGPVLFVAGIIGLGAVATSSGLGAAMANALLTVLPLTTGHDAANFASIVVISTITELFTTMPAGPSVMAPLAQHMAEASGWPLMSVLMAPIVTWGAFPFYYQAPPVVLAVALARLNIPRVTAMLSLYTAFALLVLAPLQFLWGQALGYFQ